MFVTQNTKGDNKEPPFLSSPEGLVRCKWHSVPLPSCARALLQGPISAGDLKDGGVTRQREACGLQHVQGKLGKLPVVPLSSPGIWQLC